MARRTSPLLPRVQRKLERLGERIRLARRRRALPLRLVAERAGMSIMTLRNIESGSGGATLGAYAAVLHVLGLDASLDDLAATDDLGRELQDAALPQRTHARHD